MIKKALLLSSLVKVFGDEEPKQAELASFSLLKNERYNFQLAVFADEDFSASVNVKGIDKINVYSVSEVPSTLPSFEGTDDYYLRKEPGMFPDVLSPVSGDVLFKGGKWQSIWFEIEPSADIKAGSYTIEISLDNASGNIVSKSAAAEVIDALLPKQTLIYTNWYHCDAICNYYNVEFFGDEFKRINRNFIKQAVRHGMNCILTPLFTPPLDTAVGGERLTTQLVDVRIRGSKYTFGFKKLGEWMNTCLECGIEYFEMSHLFTQWGAKHAPKIMAKDRKGRTKQIFGWDTRTSSKKYDDFVLQFGKALVAFLDKEGMRERCFFHVSDEPGSRHLATYRRRRELINKAFPGFTVIDALSELELYIKGAVMQPIPETGNADRFYGVVPNLWVYYCCGQGRDYLSNRFMAMPSQRTRVLGTQLYKYDVKGFLQWGYNFYNSRLSLRQINPYEVTDADHAFPSGDSFVVYPADNGEAYPSLRFKVFYDGLQDMRALQLLESLKGRDYTVSLVDADCEGGIRFKNYPHSDDWQLSLREKVNAEIKKAK